MLKILNVFMLLLLCQTLHANYTKTQLPYSIEVNRVGYFGNVYRGTYDKYLSYEVFSKDTPSNIPFTLRVSRGLTFETYLICFDEYGKARNYYNGPFTSDDLPREPFIIALKNPAYGEFLTFSLESSNILESPSNYILTPFPLETSENGQKLSIKLVHENQDICLYSIEGEGYFGKKVTIKTYVVGDWEETYQDIEIDGNGKFSMYHCSTREQSFYITSIDEQTNELCIRKNFFAPSHFQCLEHFQLENPEIFDDQEICTFLETKLRKSSI